MSSDAKSNLTPKLRFPEFRNEPGWKAEKLKALASLTTERAGAQKCIPMSVTSGVGLVSQQEKFGRTIAGNQFKNYLVLRRKDFAYNKSATKEFPQGFIAMYSGEELAAVPNSIFTCFKADENRIVPDFLNYLFSGNLHGKWLKKYIEVSARAHGSLSIDDEDLLSLPVPLPNGRTSRTEQEKIAECLRTLDALIGAESQKLDALRAHKKALMQQLFPREGETLARLRFPEFKKAPKWATKIGGELFTNRKEDGEEGLPIYSVTISDGMVPRASFDRDFYDIEDPAGNKKVCRGDIAYNMMRMWQGAQGVAPEDCMVSPAYVVLAPRRGVCTDFFAYLFKLPQSLHLLTATSRGLTKDRLRLYFDDFAHMRLCVPEVDEQQRIASFLSSIDELIAAQNGKVSALKIHKQGLMQQLFPSLRSERHERRDVSPLPSQLK